MENNKNLIYILGGLGLLVVLVLVFRKSGGGTTVVQGSTGASQDLPPNQARLAQQQLNTDLFAGLAGLTYGNEALRIQQGTQLAQINAGTTLGLAQVDAAKTIGSAQNTIQSQAIAAARDVGIAQASADTLRAQMMNDALASQQRAQSRDNLLSGLMSQIGNVLRSLGQPQQPRPSTGGSSGGSGSPSSGQPTSNRSPRINPRLPSVTVDPTNPFWDFNPFNEPIGPDQFAFPDLPGGFIDLAGEAPAMDGGTTFYVEDPTATVGDFFDQFGGYYNDPIVTGDWIPSMPFIDAGEPPGGGDTYTGEDFLNDWDYGFYQ